MAITRRDHRIAAVLVVLALGLALQTRVPARADGGLSITHTPPVAAIAGQDLSLTAVVTYACGLRWCGSITASAVYVQPWGGTGQVDVVWQQLGHNGSHTFTLVIPGSAVRYSSTSYKIVATQLQCQNLELCDPDTNGDPASVVYPSSGYQAVTTTNQVSFVAKSETGTALVGANWDLFLSPWAGQPAVKLLSGQTGTGGIANIAIPATTQVLSTAAANGGIANFFVHSTYAAAGLCNAMPFQANFSSTQPAAVAGTNVPAGTISTFYGCTTECDYDYPYDGTPYTEFDLGPVQGKIGTLNAVYGMSAQLTYGQNSDSDFEVALKYPSKQSPINGGFETHVGTGGDGNSRSQAIAVSDAGVPQDQANHGTKMANVRTWFRYIHMVNQYRDWSSPDPDQCFVTEQWYTSKWETQVSPNPVLDQASVQYGTTLNCNNNFNACTTPDSTGTVHYQVLARGQTSTLTEVTHAQSIAGAITLVGLSLGGHSGYSTSVTTTLSTGQQCDTWYYYDDGTKDPDTQARQIRADAGIKGPGFSATTGKPFGCS